MLVSTWLAWHRISNPVLRCAWGAAERHCKHQAAPDDHHSGTQAEHCEGCRPDPGAGGGSPAAVLTTFDPLLMAQGHVVRSPSTSRCSMLCSKRMSETVLQALRQHLVLCCSMGRWQSRAPTKSWWSGGACTPGCGCARWKPPPLPTGLPAQPPHSTASAASQTNRMRPNSSRHMAARRSAA